MVEIQNGTIQSFCEAAFVTLEELETVIKMTKESCVSQEVISNYYNLPDNEMSHLSTERNNYINMLSVALKCISELKNNNTLIEKECSYL
jgi:hypothetical protein